MTCFVPIRISPLGKSLAISMKLHVDRSLLRIHFAPVWAHFRCGCGYALGLCAWKHILIFAAQHFIGKLPPDFVRLLRRGFSRLKGLYQVMGEVLPFCRAWSSVI